MTTQQRDRLNRALDQTDKLLTLLDRTHWSRPTGCEEFNAEALSGHLLAVVNRLTVILTTGTFEGSPVTWNAEDPVTEFRRLRSIVTPHLEAVSSDQPVTMPWGPSTAEAAIGAYAAEFTVHDWDLAVALTPATEVEALLDDDLAEAAFEVYQTMLPPGERPAGVPFATQVKVPDTATPYQKLVAFTGRNPLLSSTESEAHPSAGRSL